MIPDISKDMRFYIKDDQKRFLCKYHSEDINDKRDYADMTYRWVETTVGMANIYSIGEIHYLLLNEFIVSPFHIVIAYYAAHNGWSESQHVFHY